MYINGHFFASMIQEGGNTTLDEIELGWEINIQTRRGVSIDILTTHSNPLTYPYSAHVKPNANDAQIRTILFSRLVHR